ncbi:MAG: hypothetical protein WCP11_00115 [Candidatus Saccharibacteria bacterium]
MENTTLDDTNLSFWGKRRFLLLVIIAILIAGVLVSVGMLLYDSSGAAQLDLSRPGYVNVRDKTVDSSNEFKNYPNYGLIDQKSIDEFQALYQEQVTKIKATDAFKGDPLNPDTMGINAETGQ